MTVVIGNFDHEFPSTSTRHRRDHAKLLSIISSVALLHQFQRERHTTSLGESNITYIEATEEDIACGLRLLKHSQHVRKTAFLHRLLDCSK